MFVSHEAFSAPAVPHAPIMSRFLPPKVTGRSSGQRKATLAVTQSIQLRGNADSK
jgi:hypothetical protein